jgi:N utilization substance protein A
MEAAGINNVEALAAMTPEQLMEIPGIGEKMVDKIYQAVNRFYEAGGESAVATGEIAEGSETPVEGEPLQEEVVEESSEAGLAAEVPAEEAAAETESPTEESSASSENEQSAASADEAHTETAETANETEGAGSSASPEKPENHARAEGASESPERDTEQPEEAKS